MVHDEHLQDLKNLFYLFNGIPGGLDLLLTEFEQRIKSQGESNLTARSERERRPSGLMYMCMIHCTCMQYQFMLLLTCMLHVHVQSHNHLCCFQV